MDSDRVELSRRHCREPLDDRRQVSAQDAGQPARNDDAEAVVHQLIAEGRSALGDQMTGGAPDADATWFIAALQHSCASSVPEHQRAEQVVCRRIAGTECQRRYFHRHHEGAFTRMRANPVACTCESTRTARAPEMRQGNAANVRAQRQMRHESHIDAGKDVAGARGDDEQAYVIGGSACISQRRLAGGTRKSERLRHVPRRLLGGAEGHAEFSDGAGDEADVVMEIGGEVSAATRQAWPQPGEQRDKLVAAEAMPRERRGKSGDCDRRQ